MFLTTKICSRRHLNILLVLLDANKARYFMWELCLKMFYMISPSLVCPLNEETCHNCKLELFPPWEIFHAFCHLQIIFKINIFEKFFQEYHLCVKQIGSRSGPTKCRAWSGSNLFAKAISRKHCLEDKELTHSLPLENVICFVICCCVLETSIANSVD